MGVKLVSASAGSVEIVAPATASNYTATMPVKSGTVMLDGPAFSYYQSVAQSSIATATATKITFTTSTFDTTAGMFASSRFTPTVAGYYQITGALAWNSGVNNTNILTSIYKNGTAYRTSYGVNTTAGSGQLVTDVVYLNGSTDYVEIYGLQQSGSSLSTFASTSTYFSGVLVRGA